MGGKESREPIVEHGLYKHYVGDDVFLEPIQNEQGEILNPRYATVIFLHDDGQNPQHYISQFFCKTSNRITPWDKSVHVILMQAPHVVTQHKEKGVLCNWVQDGQSMTECEGFFKVQSMITSQIQAMDGRADKLFVGGIGKGGALAMMAAFYLPDVLGGVFCADSEVPQQILNDIQREKADTLIPQFQAKQGMFLCVTKYKDMSEEQKNKIGQQAQLLRGHGFLRLTSKELKKGMDRMLCQVHPYSHLGSQQEVDRMLNERKARIGDFDKQATKVLVVGKAI